MISMFRNFFQSKIGLPIFIGFLAIVALAFAATDISGSATFGGLTGDDQVARVGDQTISANEMNGAMQNALSRARQNNPTITMPQFVASGGLEAEIELLMDRYATGNFAQEYGLRAGDNLVNSEILQIAAFRSLTGEFDQATYQAALRRQGITDSILRQDIGDGLLAQQLLRPAFGSPQLPERAARQYAALVLERRQGSIGLIPSSAFAPEADPTDEQLTSYYAENRARYTLPERRTIRFARFGADSVAEAAIVPTEEQIAERYENDAELYAASERRAISSFVVPTEEGAQALVDRIRGGISLEQAAQEAGFNVSTAEPRDREALSAGTSFALMEQVFTAEEGEVVAPSRSTLGWYVARVDTIERIAARSFDEVREEIAAQLTEESRAGALVELSSQIDELVNTGSSLTDVATQFDLETTAVTNVTADGQIFGGLGQGISPTLAPILSTAFQMDENEPQLAEVVPGAQFLVFDVSDIIESAPPPLDEIRDEVTFAWKLSEGSKLAREAADRVLAEVRNGAALEDALIAENPEFGNIDTIDLERRELFASQQFNVPAPLVLLFSMAQGSTKILEDAGDAGWFVVDLDAIVSGSIDENPGLLQETLDTLAPALVGEYNDQLMQAIRAEVGVERNDEAIEDLRKLLVGEI